MAPNRKRRRDVEDVQVEQDGTVEVTPTHPQDSELKSGPPRKKQQQRRTIFVRSLPSTATTESLISHFSQNLPIKHATAVTDPATKACKGYGFVTFADAEDAQRALQEFNGSTFSGRKIKLEIAEPRQRDVEDTIPGAVAAGEAKPRSVPSAATLEAKAKRKKDQEDASRPPKLIIRNLPWSIKKPEQLAELFKQYGKVHHATIPTKKPGLMSGFGFVTLRGRPNAEKALAAVNGLEIDGRTLAVDWAVEKEVWQGQVKNSGPQEVEDRIVVGSPLTEDESMIEHDEDVINAIDEDEESISEDEGLGSDDSTEDESEMIDDDEDEDEDEDDQTRRPADNSTTLFIRNLPFTASDETLEEHFSHFGHVRYARIVLDPNTERPKGTGFVCFSKTEDALQCLREAPRANKPVLRKKNTSATPAAQSILQNEADDVTGKFTMDGRVLQISKAVDKNEATRLTEEGIAYRGDRDKDKRHLYLLSEGTISSKSPLYDLLSPSEIAIREASAKQRKILIQKNPSLHLSLTRLSIRNIPRSITSKDLKELARKAVVGFATDVKEGKRDRLSKEELARGGEAMVAAEKLRKKKGVGIVKQAKVVFEGREGGKVDEGSGAGRSRGYGFVEYHSHRSALMGLRWLNGHAVGYTAQEAAGKGGRADKEDRKKRLIVEFALENAQVVNRRNDREVKSRERPAKGAQDAADPPGKRKWDQSDRRNLNGNGNGKGNGNGERSSRFTVVDSALAGAAKSSVKKAAKAAGEAVSTGKPSEANGKVAKKVDEKLARSTRIIARKRAARRGRKKGGVA